MGVVMVEERLLFLSRGYSYNQATLYVYCDHCGSFDISRARLGARKWLAVAVPLAYVAFVALVVSRSRVVNTGWVLLGLLGAIVLGIVLALGDTPNKDYLCRKCGNTTSTRYNTLDYSLERMTVDVPDERAEKRYFDYWPDECDLQEWLKPPPHSAHRA